MPAGTWAGPTASCSCESARGESSRESAHSVSTGIHGAQADAPSRHKNGVSLTAARCLRRLVDPVRRAGKRTTEDTGVRRGQFGRPQRRDALHSSSLPFASAPRRPELKPRSHFRRLLKVEVMRLKRRARLNVGLSAGFCARGQGRRLGPSEEHRDKRGPSDGDQTTNECNV